MSSRNALAGRTALLAAALLLIAPAPPVAAQGKRDLPRNHPSSCPYCQGDPELMRPAGLASHGGFEFGTTDTTGVDRLLGVCDIKWIETEHFELGFALGSHRVRQEEKKKIRAELTELAEFFPAIKPKTKILDPWLRTHLYAKRLEKVWDRFLELMQVTEDQFPAEDAPPWNLEGKYMGIGPYAGQDGKFEVLILPSEAASVLFLKDQFGLLIKRTQRWNVVDRDSLILIIHTQQGTLKNDGALHGHLAFNQTINLLDGYKHYSYDTQIWIREGLAHFVEREINPRFNTFDSSEGAVAEMTRKENWEPEVLKLIRKGEAKRMAQLLTLKDYAELELEHHYTTWSMIDYLVRSNPDGFACLNDRLHGITDERGYADGSNLNERHRDAFRDCLGLSYAEFDQAWAAWCLENYSGQ